MSERERWIVYPLLFLALGAALRDKLLKQTFAERIICNEMMCSDLIVLDGAEPVARLRGGTLELEGALEARDISAARTLRVRGRPVGVAGVDRGARSAINNLLRLWQEGVNRQREGPSAAPPDGGAPPASQPSAPTRPEAPPPAQDEAGG